jgi:hypothetical protein
MLKINVFVILIFCAFLMFSGCNASIIYETDNSSKYITEEITETSMDIPKVPIEELECIRVPALDEKDQAYDYSPYNESRLYYFSKTKNDEQKRLEAKTLSLFGEEYLFSYVNTVTYEAENTEYLKGKAYDNYNHEEEIVLQLHQKSGRVKVISIDHMRKTDLPVVVNDFSENSLKEAALSVLRELYGEEIDNYIDSYYTFEYAKFIDKVSSEDRYVVAYRAYLNGIATEDVIYVHFTLDGKLLGASAKNYLEFVEYDQKNLYPVKDLDVKVNEFLAEFNYSKMDLRYVENHHPVYYKRNAEGVLYYVTEWECSNSEKTCLEAVAIRAE